MHRRSFTAGSRFEAWISTPAALAILLVSVTAGCGGPPGNSGPEDVPRPSVYLPYPWDVIHQGLVDPLAGGNEANDRFGQAVVSGDFNCDGHPDLAITIRNEETGGSPTDIGAVAVLFWDETVPTYPTNPLNDGVVLFRTDPGVTRPPGNVPHASDWFGYSLAAGDFNGDGCDDLAIGIPMADSNVPAVWSNVGAFQVRRGATVSPLSNGKELSWTLGDGVHNGDYVGWALAVGDFNDDGFADLAIGAPGTRSTTGLLGAGRAYVCRGFDDLSLLVETSLPQCSYFNSAPAVPAATNQHFGYALAAGNFNGTEEVGGVPKNYSDLAVGAPGAAGILGRVIVRHGTAAGLTNTDMYAIAAVVANTSERFGQALVAADLQNDSVDDIIIGAPLTNGGRVDIVAPEVADEDEEPLPWPVNEITQSFTQDGLVRPDGADPQICLGCAFGQVLATGDFNGDELDDLAVGVISPLTSTPGYVAVRHGAPLLYGYPTNDDGYVMLDQLPVSPNTMGDEFGSAIAAIDFFSQDLLGMGIDDLAVASTIEDYGGIQNTGIVVLARPMLQDYWGDLSGVFQAATSYDGHASTVRALVAQETTGDVMMRMWSFENTFWFGAHDCEATHDGGDATYEEGEDIIPGAGAVVSGTPPRFSSSFQYQLEPNVRATIEFTVTGTTLNPLTHRYDGLHVTINKVRWNYDDEHWHFSGTCPDYGPTSMDFARVEAYWDD